MKLVRNLLIIQARTGSSRLPNKVLKEICGKPILQHIIERVECCKNIDKILVATTEKSCDDGIENLCDILNIKCYRGSENDVLDRYYQAASIYKPDNVIRVTADCPLIDSSVIDDIVETHEKGGYDYTSNTLVETFPDGLDAEIFSYSALETAWGCADLASEREHVTPYIKTKGTFKRYSYERMVSLADKRWTVDTDKDFQFVECIYNALYKTDSVFSTEDILAYLESNKEVEAINSGIVRNEGYIMSLANDYKI